jgi:hypothetical protein
MIYAMLIIGYIQQIMIREKARLSVISIILAATILALTGFPNFGIAQDLVIAHHQ